MSNESEPREPADFLRRQVMGHEHDRSSMVAETVRTALLDAAMQAYEDAGIRGLCADGRWEAAVAAIRALDVSGLIQPAAGSARPGQEAEL
jgi:hypothetical protein